MKPSPRTSDREVETRVHATFLPVSRHALTRVLVEEGPLDAAGREALTAFSTVLAHVFHFLFHQEARALKRDYRPFDPDAAIQAVFPLTAEEREQHAQRFATRFEQVLARANYHALDEGELNRLLSEHSPWSLRLQVDLDQFSQFCLYYRGDGSEKRVHRDWARLYRKREVEYPVFRRLALLVRFKDAEGLPPGVDSRSIYLKLFKNIPRAELEMLFPNTRPQMKLLDKVKVAMPLIGGTGTTLIKILGAAAISMFAASMLAVGFIGYAVKSFFGFLHVKEKYQGTLVSNLYFNSLDNNLGVIHHLVDQAEEEECKEALLAYYFLLTEPTCGCAEAALDGCIERFLQQRFGIEADFEAPDALEKLRRLDLLDEDEHGRMSAPPLAVALARLDRAWDGYFEYGDEGREERGKGAK